MTKKAVAGTPEMAALDQPNSSISGLKKTAKERWVPTPRAWMLKQMAVMR